INGQNAAWKTPKLSEPFSRARGAIVQDIVMRLVPQPNNLITPPTSPKKASQDDLDSSLKRLFKDSLKSGDRPPEMAQIKSLLDQGANPNIRLLQPKPSKERLNNLYSQPSISQNQDSSCTTKSKTLQSIYSYSSSSSIGENDSKSTFSQFYNHKLPNILFATIILCDDPAYVKMLIDYGAEALPKDSHFPNAFVFAAKHGRVEIMKYLLENVPKLSDNNENLDNEGDDSQNVGGSSGGIGAKELKQYGTKIWSGFTGEADKKKRAKILGSIEQRAQPIASTSNSERGNSLEEALSVKRWSEFLDNASNFLFSGEEEFEKPKFCEGLRARVEPDVDAAEDSTIDRGIPDHTYRVFSNGVGKIIFPIEVKRNLVIEDLIWDEELALESTHVRDSLKQIFNYMIALRS
ncbi:16264_t:CDS:2, partial [Gigaspora rosea]